MKAKIENLILIIVQKVPEKYLPDKLVDMAADIADKRLAIAKSNVVKLKWQQADLMQQLKEIQKKENGCQ